MKDNIFFEEQQFTQTWVRAVLYLVWGGLTVISIALVATKKTGPVPAVGIFVLITAMVLIFRSLKLQVRIGTDTIAYRFYPLQRKYRNINRRNVENLKVIDYDPVSDYGGWGIRFGKKGVAYTVKGNHGLYIQRKDKGPLLIGTSKPKEMEAFLQKHKIE